MKRTYARASGSRDVIAHDLELFSRTSGLSEKDSHFAFVCVEELFTNCVRHAKGTTGDVLFDFEISSGTLTIRMTEFESEPFNGNIAVSVDTPPPLQEAGGIGVHLIRNLADDLTYEYVEGNLVVTVTKRLEGAG